jgi:hypothetical protein
MRERWWLCAPSGLVSDKRGPNVYSADQLLRRRLRAAHTRKLMLPVWSPGRAARAVGTGADLAPERAVGWRTGEEVLADRVSVSSESRSSPPLAVGSSAGGVKMAWKDR